MISNIYSLISQHKDGRKERRWVYSVVWGGGWRREGEDHPFSLEVSEDVQDGVQLLTKSIQLSSLVLGHMPPALYLRLLVRLKGWPRSINHLPEKKWYVMRSTWSRSEEQRPVELEFTGFSIFGATVWAKQETPQIGVAPQRPSAGPRHLILTPIKRTSPKFSSRQQSPSCTT